LVPEVLEAVAEQEQYSQFGGATLEELQSTDAPFALLVLPPEPVPPPVPVPPVAPLPELLLLLLFSQTPSRQVWPEAQLCAQAPQLLESKSRSTHFEPQGT
jgi:hypothetical protein